MPLKTRHVDGHVKSVEAQSSHVGLLWKLREWLRCRPRYLIEVQNYEIRHQMPPCCFKVGITFQDGDRFNSCQVIYSQFGLAIHQNDHQTRRRFVEWAQNEIAVVPDFHKRILFSDEARFWLNGYVNKQNCRIWSEANPQVYVETPLHPEKTDCLELWFQQDGATCHTARATIDLLKDTFGDRLISRFGPVDWPPRSCDLTPLCKVIGYADKPQTLDHLKTTFTVLLPIYGHKYLKMSSKIGRPDWTTSEQAVTVLCQKSYLKCNATRLSFE
ncbi:DUF4817 domain-containing protein [Trichonephila clavipes]|nr:DUF4817 domain-containing protein [Trichonephila clavipes]